MNFLSDYTTFVGPTECPLIYHTWCALSTLSHLAGRRVWTDQKAYIATPQLYVLLVGEAGIRKSTAMKKSERIVATFKHIQRAPASITKEMIVKTMGEEGTKCLQTAKWNDRKLQWSQLSIFGDEFVTLLGAGGNSLGMIEFLTHMWGADEYGDATKNKGSYHVVKPYLPILACLTTETIKSLVTTKVITSGMSRRCILVWADTNGEPVAFPEHTPEQLAAYDRILQHGWNLVDFCGEFTWTEGARTIYKDFYDKASYYARTLQSTTLRGFYNTKGEFVIKVSMLIAIGQYPPSLVHTEATIQRAITLVTEVESGASILFDGQGTNELVTLLESVEFLLKNSLPKKFTYSELKARVWKDVPQGNFTHLNSVLEQLLACGKIESSLEPAFSSKSFWWRTIA